MGQPGQEEPQGGTAKGPTTRQGRPGASWARHFHSHGSEGSRPPRPASAPGIYSAHAWGRLCLSLTDTRGPTVREHGGQTAPRKPALSSAKARASDNGQGEARKMAVDWAGEGATCP